jgi:feruloyl esterase
MVPGMGHCAGGTGTDQFDPVAALDAWIDSGTAPQRIEAERIVGGETVRSRPLCAYPAVAVHDGSGSTDAAASFSCR